GERECAEESPGKSAAEESERLTSGKLFSWETLLLVFMGSCIQANFYALVSEAMRRMTAGHAWAERWRNGLRNGPMLPECTRFDPLKACLAPSDRLAIWSAQAHHPDRP